MRQIMTVTGPAEPDALGFCHSHEHLALGKGQSFIVNPVLWIDDAEKSTQEVIAFREAGGGTLIDAQPVGCGRMHAMLRAISRESGVNIVASTGFHKMCFYPEDHWIRTASAEDLAKIFLRETKDGMYEDSDVIMPDPDAAAPAGAPRAGQIKTALDTEGLTPLYERLFRAAAAAQLSSLVPLMVHIEQGSDPLALLRFLTDLGVKPEQLIFCHMDRAVADLGVHEEAARAGVFLEYDTIARFKYHSDEEELRIFRHMLDAGFGDRLLFSLDTTRARLRAYDPSAPGLDYILRVFVPKMLEAGITKEQIRAVSHDNFVRVFTA